MKRFLIEVMASILVIMSGTKGAADTFSWAGSPGLAGDWFDAENWTGGTGYPGAGDDVTINASGALVLLTNQTSVLDSFDLVAGTLIVSNWNTHLQAQSVLVNGTITLPAPFPEGGMSNRVWIACSNLSVTASGRIHADGLGYGGGEGPGKGAYGGAAPSAGGGHGGPGGMAGMLGVLAQGYALGGTLYGSPEEPVTPGSGSGGTMYRPGEPGGGVVRIEAAGHVLVNGIVSANGEDGVVGGYGRNTGGGAGGSIWITCATFGGTNGLLSACGGEGKYGTWEDAHKYSGGGGGGHIAVHFEAADQTPLPLPSVRFDASPGFGDAFHPVAEPSRKTPQTWDEYFDRRWEAGWGTLYFSDTSGVVRVSNTITNLSGHVTFGNNASSFSLDSLTLDNAYFGIDSDATITVAGSLSTATNAGLIARRPLDLSVGGPVLLRGETRLRDSVNFFCGGGLRLQEAGALQILQESSVSVNGGIMVSGSTAHAVWKGVDAAVTGDVQIVDGGWLSAMGYGVNGSVGDAAMRMEVSGDIVIESNSWIYVYSDAGQGGSPFLICDSLRVARGGGINGDGRGYGAYRGPGRGTYSTPSSGGGHGGAGGDSSSSSAGGVTNDNALLPGLPGSGGAHAIGFPGAHGGALLRVRVHNKAILDGIVTTQGANGVGTISNNRVAGGGAGGGIRLISGGTISGGSDAMLLSRGGAGLYDEDSGAGGGGGGRIAIYYNIPDSVYAEILAGDWSNVASFPEIRGFHGSWSVSGGDGWDPGEDGSVRIFRVPPPSGTIFIVR